MSGDYNKKKSIEILAQVPCINIDVLQYLLYIWKDTTLRWNTSTHCRLLSPSIRQVFFEKKIQEVASKTAKFKKYCISDINNANHM